MSSKATAIVWQSDLKNAEKWVLLAYADHADDQGGSIFPSVLRIAWKTGYSVRQVKRITKTLRDENYMVPIRKHERHKPAVYQIVFGNLPVLIPWEFLKKYYEDGKTMAEMKKLYIDSQNAGSVRGDNLSGRGDNLSARGDNLPPDPLKDPLYNDAPAREGKEDIRSRQDYIDLQNAIVTVCKRLNIMALQPNEIKAIDILYESGAKPAELRAFYGRDPGNGHGPSSWWYANDWRGKQGQVPTPANVIDTLEQARTFRPEQQTAASNAANKAWSEVNLWINDKITVTEFSSPLTIKVVQTITGSELKMMPDNQKGIMKKRFVGLFKDLEKS